MPITNPEIEEYAYRFTQPEEEILQKLVAETKSDTVFAEMLCGKLCTGLLRMLIKTSGAKRILEIGMFTGYSALAMAHALPNDGKIITCDINEQFAKIARKYFALSPHGKKIEIHIAPALETLAKQGEEFDLVYIDADKENYKNYYDASLLKLKAGGLIVIDNSLRGGEVLRPVSAAAVVTHSLNEFILRDDRVENILLPVRDGVNVVRKRS